MIRIRYFMILTLFLGVHGGLASAQGDMAIRAGAVTAAPGEEVNVPIELSDAISIGGAHVEVLYDANILRVNRVENRAIGLIEHEASQPGRVTVGWVSAETVDGNIEIVDVIFDIIDDQTKQTEIVLGNASVVDATTMQQAPVTTINGSIGIITGDVDLDGDDNNVGLWLLIIIVVLGVIGLMLFLFTRRTAAGSNASLKILAGNAFPASLAINKDLIVLGRDQGCDIVIDNDLASRHHAQISRHGETYQIADMNSTNGTKVNGANIRSRQLSSGNIIEIGDTRIQFTQQ